MAQSVAEELTAKLNALEARLKSAAIPAPRTPATRGGVSAAAAPSSAKRGAATASETEATQLREKLAQLKRQDDALYAAQRSSSTELTQLRTVLAAAEERAKAGRVALEEESTRRLEVERELRAARAERDALRAKHAAVEGTKAELSTLKQDTSSALAQYKEDNAVLVEEVQRLQAELSTARERVRVLEDTSAAVSAATQEHKDAAQTSAGRQVASVLAAAKEEAANAHDAAEKHRKHAVEAQAQLQALCAELREAAAAAAAEDETAAAPAAAAKGKSAPGGGATSASGASGSGGSGGGGSGGVAKAREAIRMLLEQRHSLRDGLRTAAEQLQQAQRKLKAANARVTQLSTHQDELKGSAEQSAQAARSAEAARERAQSELHATRAEAHRLQERLAQQSSEIGELKAAAEASSARRQWLLGRRGASEHGEGASFTEHGEEGDAEVAEAVAEEAQLEAMAEGWHCLLLQRELAATEADLFTAQAELEDVAEQHMAGVLHEHSPRTARVRAQQRVRAAREAQAAQRHAKGALKAYGYGGDEENDQMLLEASAELRAASAVLGVVEPDVQALRAQLAAAEAKNEALLGAQESMAIASPVSSGMAMERAAIERAAIDRTTASRELADRMATQRAAAERAATERSISERAAAQIERAARSPGAQIERAAAQRAAVETSAARLAEQLEEAKLVAERSTAEAARLKVQLSEAKRQLTSAFKEAETARKAAAREAERARESTQMAEAERAERERLQRACEEAEEARQAARLEAEEASMSAADKELAEVEARHVAGALIASDDH
ncbi:hypothetical protein Ctob_002313 [Chrysochromulina tobinii]|uniref:Uncharacterized protein n=1 Tax=Chrysochromulina tobinii TaxID=1460289 RepID=A0A0M0K0P5_9EUKA|nr:hypothetical protein Ctob_002313 [Chrysochromulina tobinii]|eukprot:KOO32389.1 hypothetical protein Ctob_002313 [Chrysochromulina sp. CCMP291]